jgi:MFS family permease
MSARLNYGWVIVVAMLMVQTVSSGLGFYNMSVYMVELAQLMSRPVSDLSFAVSIFFITGGVFGLFVAELITKYQIRWIMVAGAITCAIALAGMSMAREIWQVYTLFFLFGLGNTGVSIIIATTLITRWFPGRNRSIALSISSTGLSFGGVTLTPLTAYLFNTTGVYESFPMLGLIFALVIIPIAIFLVRSPAQIDQLQMASRTVPEWGYRQALNTRFFKLHSAGYALCMLAQVGGIAHFYGRIDFVSDYETASMSVQALSIASILSRFIGGLIVTRVSIRAVTLFMLVVQAIGLILIGVAEDRWQGIIAAAIFGSSVGNLLMLQPLWLAEVFPGAMYPRVFAMASALSVLGLSIGPYFLGVVVDTYGYTAAYGAAAFVCIGAWLFIFAAGAAPAEPVGPSRRVFIDNDGASEELGESHPVERGNASDT